MIDSRLNLKQREAVIAITTPIATALPPILIIGENYISILLIYKML